MGSYNLGSNYKAGEFGEKESQKLISVCDHVNSSKESADSFVVVDMEHFSHLIEENIMNSNSRTTRNLSRKGTARGGGEMKAATANERRNAMLATSTTATSNGGGTGTPEKAAGATNELTTPQIHHQITIKNPNLHTAVTERTRGTKRFGFRQSPLTNWFINPRNIVIFFATLSSMGSILLIYFTLTMSMTKLNGDENGLN